MTSTAVYWDALKQIKAALDKAECIIPGIGAGVSAAGGVNYGDSEFVRQTFPEYYKQGFCHVMQIQSAFWRIHMVKPEAYWGFWARHIWRIRYNMPVLKPYKDLLALLQNRNYFMISTNADGQVGMAGFPREKVFAPQGGYEWFQCEVPCHQTLYPNREIIKTMLDNMATEYEIRTEDVPHCPCCGRYLVPNLRVDDTFVEEPHLFNRDDYREYLEQARDRRTVFWELGVGFNTPVIIRYPFEAMTEKFPRATLVRINTDEAGVSKALAAKSVSLAADIGRVLHDLRELDGYKTKTA